MTQEKLKAFLTSYFLEVFGAFFFEGMKPSIHSHCSMNCDGNGSYGGGKKCQESKCCDVLVWGWMSRSIRHATIQGFRLLISGNGGRCCMWS